MSAFSVQSKSNETGLKKSFICSWTEHGLFSKKLTNCSSNFSPNLNSLSFLSFKELTVELLKKVFCPTESDIAIL